MLTLGEISLLKVMYPDDWPSLLLGPPPPFELRMVRPERMTFTLLMRICKAELFLTDPLGVWNI